MELMEIRPSEISSILKEQIKNFGQEAEVSEIGQVLSVGDGIARIYGLDNVQAGENHDRLRGMKAHKRPLVDEVEDQSCDPAKGVAEKTGNILSHLLWLCRRHGRRRAGRRTWCRRLGRAATAAESCIVCDRGSALRAMSHDALPA